MKASKADQVESSATKKSDALAIKSMPLLDVAGSDLGETHGHLGYFH